MSKSVAFIKENQLSFPIKDHTKENTSEEKKKISSYFMTLVRTF